MKNEYMKMKNLEGNLQIEGFGNLEFDEMLNLETWLSKVKNELGVTMFGHMNKEISDEVRIHDEYLRKKYINILEKLLVIENEKDFGHFDPEVDDEISRFIEQMCIYD